ncbi:MAG: pimeloyl-ACP methyl ester carboxylesterase [Granulosicoccus sp.]|jgi:pimeloyl-ACP methyl ester carboxylesterase
MTTTFNVILPKKSMPKPRKPEYPALPLKMMQFAFGTLGRVFPKWFAGLAFRFFAVPQNRAKHRISDRVIEQANISEILVGKNMLKTYEWGTGAKTILLVHGWQSRGTALRSFVPKLKEAGFRVVAFDAPAHGDSSGKRADLIGYGGAIKALYNKYENVTGVICHSFGGAAAAYAMYKLDPSIELERFVSIGTPAAFSYPVYNGLRTMNAPPMVRKYFIEKLERVSGMELGKTNFEYINPFLKIEKALIVHDKQDEQVDFAEAEKMVKHWKNAELQVTDGFGHFHLIKSPEVIERVVDFIKL